jgi:hypothetical protein
MLTLYRKVTLMSLWTSSKCSEVVKLMVMHISYLKLKISLASENTAIPQKNYYALFSLKTISFFFLF